MYEESMQGSGQCLVQEIRLILIFMSLFWIWVGFSEVLSFHCHLSSFCLRLFLGGSSAADFKSVQLEVLNGTCEFSSSNFFRFFLTDLDMYGESTWKSITNQFFCTCNRFIRYTVIFLVHTWNTEDSEGESLKKPGTFLLYFDSVLV